MNAQSRSLDEDLLFAAMESARTGICATTADGHILAVTSRFAASFQRGAEVLLGRQVRDILSERLAAPDVARLMDGSEPNAVAAITLELDARPGAALIRGRNLARPGLDHYRVLTLEIEDFGASGERLNETRRPFSEFEIAFVVAGSRSPDTSIATVPEPRRDERA